MPDDPAGAREADPCIHHLPAGRCIICNPSGDNKADNVAYTGKVIPMTPGETMTDTPGPLRRALRHIAAYGTSGEFPRTGNDSLDARQVNHSPRTEGQPSADSAMAQIAGDALESNPADPLDALYDQACIDLKQMQENAFYDDHTERRRDGSLGVIDRWLQRRADDRQYELRLKRGVEIGPRTLCNNCDHELAFHTAEDCAQCAASCEYA